LASFNSRGETAILPLDIQHLLMTQLDCVVRSKLFASDLQELGR